MPATLFIRHPVADYGQWKPVYDALGTLRQQMGVMGASVHRDAQDPSLLVITHRFHTLAQAHTFADSEDLKAAMGRAGVSGPPEFWFTDDVEHTSH
ncbi:cyclase [Meiothermus sp.]|jgi:hypothetical protein|uniref:cyclase n=1 Tax=Meiothermus sp. TaxID=1955249 RepID=UPI0021DEEF26|nr:cyclase [Meiothermus sp.]GIW25830.1 MAG: hypothetical protein KatS3mg069_2097 [Meiothermus sp.]